MSATTITLPSGAGTAPQLHVAHARRPRVALGILAVLFVGFVSEILPASAIAVCGAVSFLMLGYVSFDELLSVFSNSAPITIAAMFVISCGSST